MPRIAAKYPGIFQDLEQIALDSADRASRAQRAAERLRREGTFRRVGMYDLVPGGTALLAASEAYAVDEQEPAGAVVPICALGGDPVGLLEVHAEADSPLSQADRLQLEACAGVLWWLWVDAPAKTHSRTGDEHVR